MTRSLAALFLALAPLPLAAQALTPAETAQVDAAVAAALRDTGVPSASVAIVRGDRIVFAHAYGKQSETMATPDPAALYQIASVSKQFTAAAILLLQDEGKLRLDDPVSRYVPGITDGDKMTIRQLLSHTSGLQDYWPQDYSFAAMATRVTPQQIVDRWAKKPLDFAPGTQWQYSNTGYVVAGMIVEKVTGQPLLAFLQSRLLKPLGIRAIDQDLAIGPGFPQGYKRYGLGPVRVETPAAHGWLYAAGELAMSATDLAKWDVARLTRSILSPADWAQQETAVKLANGSTAGYGLGVVVGTATGHRFVEHSGEAVGFLSENIVYPDDHAAVVVLVNAWFGNAQSRIAGAISTIVLPATAPAADAADRAALVAAKRTYAQLQAGTLDPAGLTADAIFYFTPAARGDYAASLAPLGTPTSFTQMGKARLRGGFVSRTYRLTYPGRTLTISTYAEERIGGRYEQFLVTPAE